MLKDTGNSIALMELKVVFQKLVRYAFVGRGIQMCFNVCITFVNSKYYPLSFKI